MKKPILSGLCLALSYLSFSQAFNAASGFSPTVLNNSLEQYSLYEHNLNTLVSLQSQWSSLPDHPYYANIGASIIPDPGKTTKPEASLSIKADSYGPFKRIGSTISFGVLKSIDRNHAGYRGGIQLGYEQSQLDNSKLVWIDPELENGSYRGTNTFGLGYYLGGWYSTGTSKARNLFALTFESSDILHGNNQADKSKIVPYSGRYSFSYNYIVDEYRFSGLYQMDLDASGKPVHLIAVRYYFPFKLYGGVLGTSTKTAGFTTGYYWTMDNYWDTLLDISYQYIHSFEEYGLSAGGTHQILIRCSGKF